MKKTIDRIFEYIVFSNTNVKRFSEAIGVSTGYLAKQRKNKANIGSHIIQNMVSVYPDINLQWLITGEGEMLNIDKKNTQHIIGSNSNKDTNSINTVFYKVKTARELLGLTQSEVAAHAGILQKDISMIEKGNRNFIPNRYFSFLEQKGIDLNSLFNNNTMAAFKWESGDSNELKRCRSDINRYIKEIDMLLAIIDELKKHT